MERRPYEQRELTTGNVIGEALSLYQRFILHFLSIALAIFLVINLVSALVTVPDNDTVASLIAVLAIIATLVGFFAVQGALAIAVDDVRDGRVDVTYRELLARTAQRLPHLVAAGVLIAVGLSVIGVVLVVLSSSAGVLWLGIIAVIAIVLFFLTRWSLATPVVVLERRGPIEALKRSWTLVGGHGGRVFWIIFLSGLMAGIAAGIIRAIVGAILNGFLDVWLTSTVVNAITTPFIALTWTLMYFHLRPEETTAQPIAAAAIPAGAAYTDE